MNMGGDDFIPKPFDLEVLTAKIQALLRRSYDFAGNSRTVDTHVKTLRQKLGSEGQWIVTLIRSGYKFEVRL